MLQTQGGGGGGGILAFVRGMHAGNFPPTLEWMYYHNSLTVSWC